MAPINGKAVCIHGGMKPYMDKLEEICNRPETKDLPLFVLAVAGEFRTGKSFLLSYFLRYLANHPQKGDHWMGDENEPLTGFDHKSTAKPVTQGINIWNDPIILEGPDNKKMLVLIMDCQGIFGAEDEEVATRIFALATMVSSVMIFNLSKQINQSVLGNLELFTAYAHTASSGDANRKPFQKAMLLIRDWQNEEEFPFGYEGGKKYYDYMNKGKQSFLDDSYREMECYLMPKPGSCVDTKKYNGNHRELDSAFKDKLKELAESVLCTEHVGLHLKEATGHLITAAQFFEYFKDCSGLLAHIDWKDPTANILKMHAKFSSGLAREEARGKYITHMEEKTNTCKDTRTNTFITETQLKEIDNEAADIANKVYENKSEFTRKNDHELYQNEKIALSQELVNLFITQYKKMWQLYKNWEEAKYNALTAEEKTKKIGENLTKAREAGVHPNIVRELEAEFEKARIEEQRLKGIEKNAQAVVAGAKAFGKRTLLLGIVGGIAGSIVGSVVGPEGVIIGAEMGVGLATGSGVGVLAGGVMSFMSSK